jgi:hypothetical protein
MPAIPTSNCMLVFHSLYPPIKYEPIVPAFNEGEMPLPWQRAQFGHQHQKTCKHQNQVLIRMFGWFIIILFGLCWLRPTNS